MPIATRKLNKGVALLIFPRHLFPFIIVITNAKMFLKVFFRVFQIVLRLGRDHTQTLSEPARDFLQTLQVRVPILW
jgi:hypothetical protein